MKRYCGYFLFLIILLVSACINSLKNKTDDSTVDSNHLGTTIRIDTNNKSFAGDWEYEKNDSDYYFGVTLVIKGDELFGTYDCSSVRRNRMDVSYDSNDYSFKIREPKGNSFTTKFKDYYGGGYGMVKISMIGGKLLWQMTTPPKSDYFLPDSVILVVHKDSIGH